MTREKPSIHIDGISGGTARQYEDETTNKNSTTYTGGSPISQPGKTTQTKPQHTTPENSKEIDTSNHLG